MTSLQFRSWAHWQPSGCHEPTINRTESCLESEVSCPVFPSSTTSTSADCISDLGVFVQLDVEEHCHLWECPSHPIVHCRQGARAAVFGTMIQTVGDVIARSCAPSVRALEARFRAHFPRKYTIEHTVFAAVFPSVSSVPTHPPFALVFPGLNPEPRESLA